MVSINFIRFHHICYYRQFSLKVNKNVNHIIIPCHFVIPHVLSFLSLVFCRVLFFFSMASARLPSILPERTYRGGRGWHGERKASPLPYTKHFVYGSGDALRSPCLR